MTMENINVKSLHFKARRPLLDFVWKKAEQLNRFYNKIESCDVILKTDNDNKKENKVVEINIAIPGKHLIATDKASTFELAMDTAISEMKNQLTKYKEKRKSL
jgi:putative sigma-54 modulation protein